MIRKNHNHKLQTNPRHREEEPQDIYCFRSKAVGLLFSIHCFMFLKLFVGVLLSGVLEEFSITSRIVCSKMQKSIF